MKIMTPKSLSQKAQNLLCLLAELEDQGYIENGTTNLIVTNGYDEGSLETQASPIITPKGHQFLQNKG